MNRTFSSAERLASYLLDGCEHVSVRLNGLKTESKFVVFRVPASHSEDGNPQLVIVAVSSQGSRHVLLPLPINITESKPESAKAGDQKKARDKSPSQSLICADEKEQNPLASLREDGKGSREDLVTILNAYIRTKQQPRIIPFRPTWYSDADQTGDLLFFRRTLQDVWPPCTLETIQGFTVNEKANFILKQMQRTCTGPKKGLIAEIDATADPLLIDTERPRPVWISAESQSVATYRAWDHAVLPKLSDHPLFEAWMIVWGHSALSYCERPHHVPELISRAREALSKLPSMAGDPEFEKEVLAALVEQKSLRVSYAADDILLGAIRAHQIIKEAVDAWRDTVHFPTRAFRDADSDVRPEDRMARMYVLAAAVSAGGTLWHPVNDNLFSWRVRKDATLKERRGVVHFLDRLVRLIQDVRASRYESYSPNKSWKHWPSGQPHLEQQSRSSTLGPPQAKRKQSRKKSDVLKEEDCQTIDQMLQKRQKLSILPSSHIVPSEKENAQEQEKSDKEAKEARSYVLDELPSAIRSESYMFGARRSLFQHQRDFLHTAIRREQDPMLRGGFVADEMGTGKTLQLLMLILSYPDSERGNTLVVAPASAVRHVWLREISNPDNWAPGTEPPLKALVFDKESGSSGSYPDESDLLRHDIVIASYSMLRTHVVLRRIAWKRFILDESTNVKSPKTEQYSAAKEVRADFRWALSGTPVENRMDDYFGQLRILDISPYAHADWQKECFDQDRFSMFFHTMVRRSFVGVIPARLIQQAPYFVEMSVQERTTYLEVAHDAAIKYRETYLRLADSKAEDIPKVRPEFTREYTHKLQEAAQVESKTDSLISAVRLLLSTVELPKDSLAPENDSVRIVLAEHHNFLDRLILTGLTSTKAAERAIRSRWLLPKPYARTAYIAWLGTLPESQLSQRSGTDPSAEEDLTVSMLQDLRSKKWTPTLRDGVWTLDPESCASSMGSKFPFTIDPLLGPRIPRSGMDKFLVFVSSQSRALQIAQQLADSCGCKVVAKAGTGEEHEQAVDSFLLDKSVRGLVLAYRTGAHALNLQSANTIFFLDSDWNPAIRLQALMRSYRIGQTRDVFAYTLLARNTIDEYMHQVIQRKVSLFKENVEALARDVVDDELVEYIQQIASLEHKT
eukprot:TRINITY_DN964_c2_g1_i1.p1 TRINITY_DN964_c2_g1~~TRINITY_DN964_c2_g1_i1.p1  ORF type:complete len:1137 (+),score=206.93 TRINITY_DN964_c2_g1_i1:417-3827(+)